MAKTLKTSHEVQSLKGTVPSLTGPVILPSDNQRYLVFAFQVVLENRTANGVFYLPLQHSKAIQWASDIFRAIIQKTEITVSWTADKKWDPITDPSYVICNVG